MEHQPRTDSASRASATPQVFAARDGLATLHPHALALRSALEERFLGWAAECGARPTIYPPLISVEALDRLDYFQNFPHLVIIASGIASDVVEDSYVSVSGTRSIPAEHLETGRYALPSAACYNVFLDLEGRVLDQPYYVTTGANCFRRERHFEGLQRLLGFYMREIVCVGHRDVVLEHLSSCKQRIQELLAAVGLPVEIEPASDPFYDPRADRAVMQQLFPVKEEVVYDGELAIASLNHHRNFFGERCGIRLADGSHAFSSCVAFGLERWISALTTHFGNDTTELCDRIASAG